MPQANGLQHKAMVLWAEYSTQGAYSDAPGRDADAAARRALVLNAMLQIAFKAPISVIREWIASNGLDGELSSSERAILEKDDGDLTEQERTGEAFMSRAKPRPRLELFRMTDL